MASPSSSAHYRPSRIMMITAMLESRCGQENQSNQLCHPVCPFQEVVQPTHSLGPSAFCTAERSCTSGRTGGKFFEQRTAPIPGKGSSDMIPTGAYVSTIWDPEAGSGKQQQYNRSQGPSKCLAAELSNPSDWGLICRRPITTFTPNTVRTIGGDSKQKSLQFNPGRDDPRSFSDARGAVNSLHKSSCSLPLPSVYSFGGRCSGCTKKTTCPCMLRVKDSLIPTKKKDSTPSYVDKADIPLVINVPVVPLRRKDEDSNNDDDDDLSEITISPLPWLSETTSSCRESAKHGTSRQSHHEAAPIWTRKFSSVLHDPCCDWVHNQLNHRPAYQLSQFEIDKSFQLESYQQPSKTFGLHKLSQHANTNQNRIMQTTHPTEFPHWFPGSSWSSIGDRMDEDQRQQRSTQKHTTTDHRDDEHFPWDEG